MVFLYTLLEKVWQNQPFVNNLLEKGSSEAGWTKKVQV